MAEIIKIGTVDEKEKTISGWGFIFHNKPGITAEYDENLNLKKVAGYSIKELKKISNAVTTIECRSLTSLVIQKNILRAYGWEVIKTDRKWHGKWYAKLKRRAE